MLTCLQLQLRVFGQHGILGDHVQVHVTLMQNETDHAASLGVTCLALVLQLRKVAAQVKYIQNTIPYFPISTYFSNAVEGSWTTFNPWGTCLGTCDTDAKRNRTRNFSGGNMPCSGIATDVQSCLGLSLKFKRHHEKLCSYSTNSS